MTMWEAGGCWPQGVKSHISFLLPWPPAQSREGFSLPSSLICPVPSAKSPSHPVPHFPSCVKKQVGTTDSRSHPGGKTGVPETEVALTGQGW